MILHDAAAAFITVIDAATAWVEGLAAALAFVLCVVAFAAGPLIAPAIRRTRRHTPTPVPAPARRPVPSWAHTQPHNYDEAA